MKKKSQSSGLRRQMASPGKAAMRVKPRMAGANFQGGDESYRPKGLKTYSNSRRISGPKG